MELNLFVDDIREAPENFVKVASVFSAIEIIRHNKVNILSLDHDLGAYACHGGDAIKILEWLEEAVYNEPDGMKYLPNSVVFHTANPVGRDNMTRIWNSLMRKRDHD